MPSAFVPFMSGARKAAASGVPIPASARADAAAMAGAFAAIVPNAASAGSTAAHAGHSTTKPTVTLQRDGDRVTAIRIQCGCGEVIELECSY